MRAEAAPVAIIPARGGSKRIPKKNVRPFLGVPLIARSIRCALDSGAFGRVIVSTDDAAIERVALDAGAEVPFRRPAELADDHATTDAVLLHALGWLEERGELVRYACCLYATAPLLRPADLAAGLGVLRDRGATTALSVATYPAPPQRALRAGEEGFLRMNEPAHRLTRSQDLDELWHDAGQFYWVDVEAYRRAGALYNDRMAPVALERHRVQDIDTPEDWTRAELLARVIEQTDP